MPIRCLASRLWSWSSIKSFRMLPPLKVMTKKIDASLTVRKVYIKSGTNNFINNRSSLKDLACQWLAGFGLPLDKSETLAYNILQLYYVILYNAIFTLDEIAENLTGNQN